MRHTTVGKWTKLVLINCVIFILIVLLFEGILYTIYTLPPSFKPVIDAVRKYHLTYERLTLHYMPECFAYDNHLAYVLRKEGCNYSSREFEMEIISNSARFRDSEEALFKPEIVVIGDSHTFGWGITAEETFAKHLERLTGRKTLNAGIPSYGTYRETEQLSRIDTSNLKFLVIQYSDNDTGENRPFVKGGYKLRVRSEQQRLFLAKAERERANEAFIGQNLKRFWPLIFSNLKQKEASPNKRRLMRRNRKEAEIFLDILGRSAHVPKQIPILVIELNSYNDNDSYFVDSLREKIATWGKRDTFFIYPINISKKLTDNHYFIYDDHIRPSGHRMVAEVLTAKLNEIESKNIQTNTSPMRLKSGES